MILFRAYLAGRASIVHCQKALVKLCFQKKQSCGLAGVALKALLTKGSLDEAELKFLSKNDTAKLLEYGAHFWMTLKKMLEAACSRA